jgi:hypothetical protein
MNRMNEAIISYHTNKKFNIQVVNRPFPITWETANLEGTADGFSAMFIFAIGMSFIPAGIATFIVMERID